VIKGFTRRLVPRQRIGGDDTLGRGVEIAVSVLIFTVAGLVIDSRAGTTPWLTIGLFVFSVTGSFVRLYYVYSARMASLEAERKERVAR
jgi:F0F1-type ATP synthase assembly protein I